MLNDLIHKSSYNISNILKRAITEAERGNIIEMHKHLEDALKYSKRDAGISDEIAAIKNKYYKKYKGMIRIAGYADL